MREAFTGGMATGVDIFAAAAALVREGVGGEDRSKCMATTAATGPCHVMCLYRYALYWYDAGSVAGVTSIHVCQISLQCHRCSTWLDLKLAEPVPVTPCLLSWAHGSCMQAEAGPLAAAQLAGEPVGGFVVANHCSCGYTMWCSEASLRCKPSQLCITMWVAPGLIITGNSE